MYPLRCGGYLRSDPARGLLTLTSIVLFDFGNVVADWNPEPWVAEFARLAGLTSSEVRERLSTDDFWIELMRQLELSNGMNR